MHLNVKMSLIDEIDSLNEEIKHGNKHESLQKAKLLVSEVTTSSLKSVLRPEHLLPIIDCLSSKDKNITNTAVSVLSTVLPLLHPEEIINTAFFNFEAGLHSELQTVENFCLNEVLRWCSTHAGCNAVINKENIVLSVMDALEKNLSTARIAVEILVSIGSDSVKSAEVLFSGKYLNKLYSCMKTNDEVKFRVYDVVVKTLSTSPSHLDVCVQNDILENCVKELRKDDILLRAACISIINEIGSTSHGFSYLVRSDAISTLITLANSAKTDPFGHLYMPQVIKFFGYMSVQQSISQVLEVFSDFLVILCGIILDPEFEAKEIAIETFGLIASRNEGKLCLAKHGDKPVNCLREISSLINHGSTTTRQSCIEAYTNAIRNEEPNEEVEKIGEKWFDILDRNPVEKVLELCKQPFLEIRCASLRFLKHLCKTPWGVRKLACHAGFVEYVLDRTTEMEKVSKDAKYDVVKSIATNEECNHVFGDQNYIRFRTFVNEGPYFVMAQSQVAVEDA